MTYGQGLLIGVLVSFFACIISSFYTYIQNAIIDPDYIGRVMNAQKEWMTTFMQSSGVSETQIEDAISKIDEKAASVNHITNFFTSILSGTVFGLILSLISSAILKKNKDIFAEADVIDQEVN
jgi:predicted PurR-regulated permease PerM